MSQQSRSPGASASARSALFLLQHQMVSQPGLSRALILDLLDKLRNPGKGPLGGENEDDEPEVSLGGQRPLALA